MKISTDTNFSENFMFISFAVLEKTVVDFEKKSKTIFSKIVSFRNDEDMNMILLFYKSGMAGLKFLHSCIV